MTTTHSEPTRSSGNAFFSLILLGCVLLLGVSFWFGQKILQQPGEHLFAPNPTCALPQQSCSASKGNHHIRFSIDANQLSAKAPFVVRVEVSGYNKPQITIKLESISMLMGASLTTLEQQSDGSYQAEVRLPVCSFDTRQWRASILINDPAGTDGSWFNFETD